MYHRFCFTSTDNPVKWHQTLMPLDCITSLPWPLHANIRIFDHLSLDSNYVMCIGLRLSIRIRFLPQRRDSWIVSDLALTSRRPCCWYESVHLQSIEDLDDDLTIPTGGATDPKRTEPKGFYTLVAKDIEGHFQDLSNYAVCAADNKRQFCAKSSIVIETTSLAQQARSHERVTGGCTRGTSSFADRLC